MKTSCGKFLNLAPYFPYDVKLQLLAHNWGFIAKYQKARNAIVGAENLLIIIVIIYSCYQNETFNCFTFDLDLIFNISSIDNCGLVQVIKVKV